MLLPALLAGLVLSGAGIGVQAVDTPQAGLPSAAARTAAPPPVAAPSPADAKPAGGDVVVCKNDAQTGTRFPTRVCHTKDQWAEITRQARDFVNGSSHNYGCVKAGC